MTDMQKTLGMSQRAIDLADKYTAVVECGCKRYTARMEIGNQYFTFTRGLDDKEEAEWFTCMLGKALEKLLNEESHSLTTENGE